ncbi:hypothetical protein SPI_01659 [Niveomyces insectorum RCEF 264]|uniref:Uncharacterized protein n=1 Tax=Niveomyces insectorum RCEF 264 TaxID=1081102 RepID=A0A167Z4M7_9HYPO|nr:hypothetical protein SPI_01659 [Niveomyces insectorum RCEF 264]
MVDVAQLVSQMHETLSTIHDTIASLSVRDHEAKLDDLEQSRDAALAALRNGFALESDSLVHKREAQRAAVAEQRRREDEEREARRRREDEAFQALAAQEDGRRQSKLEQDQQEVEASTETLMASVEEEAKRMLDAGKAKLTALEERRRELNRLIDEQLQLPLPTAPTRRKAKQPTPEETMVVADHNPVATLARHDEHGDGDRDALAIGISPLVEEQGPFHSVEATADKAFKVGNERLDDERPEMAIQETVFTESGSASNQNPEHADVMTARASPELFSEETVYEEMQPSAIDTIEKAEANLLAVPAPPSQKDPTTPVFPISPEISQQQQQQKQQEGVNEVFMEDNGVHEEKQPHTPALSVVFSDSSSVFIASPESVEGDGGIQRTGWELPKHGRYGEDHTEVDTNNPSDHLETEDNDETEAQLEVPGYDDAPAADEFENASCGQPSDNSLHWVSEEPLETIHEENEAARVQGHRDHLETIGTLGETTTHGRFLGQKTLEEQIQGDEPALSIPGHFPGEAERLQVGSAHDAAEVKQQLPLDLSSIVGAVAAETQQDQLLHGHQQDHGDDTHGSRNQDVVTQNVDDAQRDAVIEPPHVIQDEVVAAAVPQTDTTMEQNPAPFPWRCAEPDVPPESYAYAVPGYVDYGSSYYTSAQQSLDPSPVFHETSNNASVSDAEANWNYTAGTGAVQQHSTYLEDATRPEEQETSTPQKTYSADEQEVNDTAAYAQEDRPEPAFAAENAATVHGQDGLFDEDDEEDDSGNSNASVEPEHMPEFEESREQQRTTLNDNHRDQEQGPYESAAGVESVREQPLAANDSTTPTTRAAEPFDSVHTTSDSYLKTGFEAQRQEYEEQYPYPLDERDETEQNEASFLPANEPVVSDRPTTPDLPAVVSYKGLASSRHAPKQDLDDPQQQQQQQQQLQQQQVTPVTPPRQTAGQAVCYQGSDMPVHDDNDIDNLVPRDVTHVSWLQERGGGGSENDVATSPESARSQATPSAPSLANSSNSASPWTATTTPRTGGVGHPEEDEDEDDGRRRTVPLGQALGYYDGPVVAVGDEKSRALEKVILPAVVDWTAEEQHQHRLPQPTDAPSQPSTHAGSIANPAPSSLFQRMRNIFEPVNSGIGNGTGNGTGIGTGSPSKLTATPGVYLAAAGAPGTRTPYPATSSAPTRLVERGFLHGVAHDDAVPSVVDRDHDDDRATTGGDNSTNTERTAAAGQTRILWIQTTMQIDDDNDDNDNGKTQQWQAPGPHPPHNGPCSPFRLAWLRAEGWRQQLRKSGDVVEACRWEWRVEDQLRRPERETGWEGAADEQPQSGRVEQLLRPSAPVRSRSWRQRRVGAILLV